MLKLDILLVVRYSVAFIWNALRTVCSSVRCGVYMARTAQMLDILLAVRYSVAFIWSTLYMEHIAPTCSSAQCVYTEHTALMLDIPRAVLYSVALLSHTVLMLYIRRVVSHSVIIV